MSHRSLLCGVHDRLAYFLCRRPHLLLIVLVATFASQSVFQALVLHLPLWIEFLIVAPFCVPVYGKSLCLLTNHYTILEARRRDLLALERDLYGDDVDNELFIHLILPAPERKLGPCLDRIFEFGPDLEDRCICWLIDTLEGAFKNLTDVLRAAPLYSERQRRALWAHKPVPNSLHVHDIGTNSYYVGSSYHPEVREVKYRFNSEVTFPTVVGLEPKRSPHPDSIGAMTPGQKGFTYPWALHVDENYRCSLIPDYIVTPSMEGSARMLITRREEGFDVLPDPLDKSHTYVPTPSHQRHLRVLTLCGEITLTRNRKLDSHYVV